MRSRGVCHKRPTQRISTLNHAEHSLSLSRNRVLTIRNLTRRASALSSINSGNLRLARFGSRKRNWRIPSAGVNLGSACNRHRDASRLAGVIPDVNGSGYSIERENLDSKHSVFRMFTLCEETIERDIIAKLRENFWSNGCRKMSSSRDT